MSAAPYIVDIPVDRNQELARQLARQPLLEAMGNATCTPSQVGSTRKGFTEMRLGEYIEDWMERDLSRDPEQNRYVFGEFGDQWAPLRDVYVRPPCRACDGELAAVTIGLGGLHSGAPWHFHNAAFVEVLHGAKHFALLPPEDPAIDDIKIAIPNLSQLHWHLEERPALERAGRLSNLQECVIRRGELLYFPDQWHHGASEDPLASIEELAAQGNIAKAEELLSQTTRSGGRPSEACFDVLIQAFDRDKQCAKAEEWLLRACELGCQPSEASFFTVIASLCQLGSLSRAEELTLQMMRSRIRPSKELFNMIIQLFAEQCDAPKVEEWLLNAGQSGWTPEQAAFDSVVLLWAEVDALKAEEWLSRGQQTEYRLPDECYGAVVKAFLRAGNSSKVNEWLSRMLGENRVPSDSLLHEVISLHIETGDIPRAEAWLTQLAGRSSTSVDGLRTALFDVAMRTGDIVYAERQLAALGEADAERTMQAVSVLMDRGDAARAKVLCERYRSLGGAPNLDICNALLYACSATGDAAGAERAVRALASAEPLTESQAALLRRAVGDDRAADLLDELCGVEDAGLPPGAQTEQPAQAPGLHRERSPTTLPSMAAQASSGAPKTSIGDRSSTKKTAPPSSTSGRTPASKAASVASAKAQARRGPSTSGAGAATARTRPMR